MYTFNPINWRFIFIVVAALIALHFILSSNDFHPLERVLPQSMLPAPHQPSEDKNFYDFHDMKPVAETTSESPQKENAHIATADTKESTSTIESADVLATTLTTLTKTSSANSEATAESQTAPENGSAKTSTAGAAAAATGMAEEEYVAICLAIKDQSRDLPEWLTHHYHHVGIKRFYIMDDGSDPPLSSRNISYGIPESAITFHYQDRATRAPAMQGVFYSQCVEWHGSNHTWMAFIDGDEFFEATSKEETLEEILKGFEPDDLVGALGVNWQVHTSNGLLKRPESARKAFTKCLVDSTAEEHGGTDDNHHIKSIVKTSFFTGTQNPHKFSLRDGAMTVGEMGDVIESIAWRSPITRSRIALHHYSVKSREEYEEKMQRSNGMNDPKGNGYWEHVESFPSEDCKSMAQYNP